MEAGKGWHASVTYSVSPKVQARRVYEILRLQATDKSNAEQYKEYRLMVKNKLNSSYQVCVCPCVCACVCPCVFVCVCVCVCVCICQY